VDRSLRLTRYSCSNVLFPAFFLSPEFGPLRLPGYPRADHLLVEQAAVRPVEAARGSGGEEMLRPSGAERELVLAHPEAVWFNCHARGSMVSLDQK
jgi:hypothetical protein